MRLDSLLTDQHRRRRSVTAAVTGRRASRPRRRLGTIATVTTIATAGLVLSACGSSKPSATTETTATPATDGPTTTTVPVAAGFAPVSVTFVSSDQGFVLGSLPCPQSA